MSERDLQISAFLSGARHIRDVYMLPNGPDQIRADMRYAREAYPPKTEQRPREVEVTFKGTELRTSYRFDDGEFQMLSGGMWVPSASAKHDEGQVTFEAACFTPADMAALAELIDNPTETVEVDD
jgi:hypothetical protein